jgi:hypothetical protein
MEIGHGPGRLDLEGQAPLEEVGYPVFGGVQAGHGRDAARQVEEGEEEKTGEKEASRLTQERRGGVVGLAQGVEDDPHLQGGEEEGEGDLQGSHPPGVVAVEADVGPEEVHGLGQEVEGPAQGQPGSGKDLHDRALGIAVGQGATAPFAEHHAGGQGVAGHNHTPMVGAGLRRAC